MKEDKPAFTTLLLYRGLQKLIVGLNCGHKKEVIVGLNCGHKKEMIVGFTGCSDTILNQITTMWMNKVT